MSELDRRLESYQLEHGQLLSRARALRLQADDVERDAKLVEAKIAGILEAREVLGDVADALRGKPRQRNRPLSGPWKQILTSLALFEEGEFGYDELESCAGHVKHDVTRDTLRSQMSVYKNAGLIEALSLGRFRLTDKGRAAAGIQTQSEALASKQNEPPEGGSDAEPGGASNTSGLDRLHQSRPQGAGESE